MSRRLLKTEALVLKSSKFGEIHKALVLFTSGQGILYVNAYGAAKGKSKLSGVVGQFSLLSVNLYHDPVKNSYKLTDAHILKEHGDIQTNLKKYYSVSIMAEVIMKSYGGGEAADIFPLLTEFLRQIDVKPAKQTCNILVQFFWRYIRLSGFEPDLRYCASCGRLMDDSSAVSLDCSNHAVYCEQCRQTGVYRLTRGEVSYLQHTAARPLEAALQVGVGRDSEGHLLNVLIHYTEGILETSIASVPLWREI